MLSAPLVEQASPRPKVSDRPIAEEGESPRTDREYARNRLNGTPWARSPAIILYGWMLRFGRTLGRLGVSADVLTGSSLALAVLASVAAALGSFGVAAVMVLSSGLCDAFDGIVARSTGRATRFGALLDSTVDRLSDGFPLLGVAVFYADTGRLAVALPAFAMMGAFTVSYVRARTEALGGVLPPLFMRRAERVVLLVITFLLAPVQIAALALPAPLLLVGVSAIGVFSFVGAASALISARRVLVGPRSVSVVEPSE